MCTQSIAIVEIYVHYIYINNNYKFAKWLSFRPRSKFHKYK